MPALRTRNALGLFKTESTEGVDASPTNTSNAISSIALQLGFNPNVIEDNELRGGLGAGDIVIGATPMSALIRANLRGSGVGSTAPEWADIWESCGLLETVNSTPNPASGATACSGSGTTTTLIFSAASTNWPTTSGSLIGQPVEIGGTESPAVVSFITDYQHAAGTITMTIADELSTSTTTSTTVKKLVNVLYAPHSGTIPSGTFYRYLDGTLTKVLGCRGDFMIDWTAGGKGTFEARLNGVYGGKTDTAVPTPTLPTTQPPVWIAGRMAINRKAVAASRFSIGCNNGGSFPANPNAAEGLDPYVVTGRSVQGSVNPLLTLVATRDLFADLRGQTVRVVSAMLGARSGGTTGNRLGAVVLNAKFRGYGEEDDGGLVRESVPFQCQGVNNEFYLTVF